MHASLGTPGLARHRRPAASWLHQCVYVCSTQTATQTAQRADPYACMRARVWACVRLSVAQVMVWSRYVEALMSAGETDAVKTVFGRCLMQCPSVDLWFMYLKFIKKVIIRTCCWQQPGACIAVCIAQLYSLCACVVVWEGSRARGWFTGQPAAKRVLPDASQLPTASALRGGGSG